VIGKGDFRLAGILLSGESKTELLQIMGAKLTSSIMLVGWRGLSPLWPRFDPCIG